MDPLYTRIGFLMTRFSQETKQRGATIKTVSLEINTCV